MKLQYLGTAAAEGVPSLFCTCDTCRRTLEAGGKNIRTRSQAIVNDELLIDYPPDTYMHLLTRGLDLRGISHCLITHSHGDHLFPMDLAMRRPGYAVVPNGSVLHLYGSDKVMEKLLPLRENPRIADSGVLAFHEVKAYEPFKVLSYTVTPVPAHHDEGSGPFLYLIDDGQKTLLYAHDTAYLDEPVWKWLTDHPKHIDYISLDCTHQLIPGKLHGGHLGLDTCRVFMDRMKETGCADPSTRVCLNHFSHNGGATYDELVPLAAECGCLVSYDGMTVEI